GHSVGDDVLRTVAGRLAAVVAAFVARHPDLVLARFGGDEVVIVLRHADAREIGMQVAEACTAAFEEPIAYDALEFYTAPSIGIAVFPDDGADVATVLQHADTAM